MTACNQSTNENEKIYTENDIFLWSYECGYQGDFPQFTIIIETEEQLDYAEQNYGMKELFQELAVQYSVEEYTYVIKYDEVAMGGYYLHADRLKINENGPFFLMDSKSHEPRSDSGPAVMGGFMHMAAIPKEYLMDCDLTGRNIIYPGE